MCCVRISQENCPWELNFGQPLSDPGMSLGVLGIFQKSLSEMQNTGGKGEILREVGASLGLCSHSSNICITSLRVPQLATSPFFLYLYPHIFNSQELCFASPIVLFFPTCSCFVTHTVSYFSKDVNHLCLPFSSRIINFLTLHFICKPQVSEFRRTSQMYANL